MHKYRSVCALIITAPPDLQIQVLLYKKDSLTTNQIHNND